MRKGWWTKSLLLVFILPWATPALPAYISIHWLLNGPVGNAQNVLYLLFGINGPIYLERSWLDRALFASNIGAYIWKYTPCRS